MDERHRIAMIKYETTQAAVKDIDKYYTALDKVSLSTLHTELFCKGDSE